MLANFKARSWFESISCVLLYMSVSGTPLPTWELLLISINQPHVFQEKSMIEVLGVGVGGPLMGRVRECSGCSPVLPGVSAAAGLKEDVSSLYQEGNASG